MTPNSLLAIAIPTYNRCEILRENLQSMLPELLEYRVAVYLSDDSSDERTRQMADDIGAEYPLLVYRKNTPRLGHDANFAATLSMPVAEYVWYLGDSQFFVPGSLGKVLAALADVRPDFCFVDASALDGSTRLIEGDSVHPFLLERTWYLTLTGATIFGRASRSLPIPETRWLRWRNFPQLGLILETCAVTSPRLLWLEPQMLSFNRKKKSSYWAKSAFSVFVGDWTAIIRSFPTLFTHEEQDCIIRSHGVNTGLFSVTSIVYLRALGALTVEELDRHYRDFALVSPISPIWARLVARLPQRLIAAAWSRALSMRDYLRGYP